MDSKKNKNPFGLSEWIERKTSGTDWVLGRVAGQKGVTDAVWLSGLCRDGAQRAAKGLFLI